MPPVARLVQTHYDSDDGPLVAIGDALAVARIADSMAAVQLHAVTENDTPWELSGVSVPESSGGEVRLINRFAQEAGILAVKAIFLGFLIGGVGLILAVLLAAASGKA